MGNIAAVKDVSARLEIRRLRVEMNSLQNTMAASVRKIIREGGAATVKGSVPFFFQHDTPVLGQEGFAMWLTPPTAGVGGIMKIRMPNSTTTWAWQKVWGG